MKALICGGRDFYDYNTLFSALDRIHTIRKITLVIEGEQRGADLLARTWAEENQVPVLPFPAEWNRLGSFAGHARNSRMLNEGKPDLVIAFPGGKGTMNMVNQAKAAGVPVVAGLHLTVLYKGKERQGACQA